MQNKLPQLYRWMMIAAILSPGALSRAQQTQPTSQPAPMGLQASSITLHLHESSLASAAEDISKQSGNRIIVNPPEHADQPQPTVTLDVVGQPFFAVMDQLCAQTGASYGVGDGGAIIVSPPFSYVQRAKEPVRINTGPVLLIAQRLDHANVLTVADNAADYCELQLSGTAEPRLHVLYCASAGLPDQAVDENGLSLVPPAGTSLDDPRAEGRPPPGHENHVDVMQGGMPSSLSYHLLLKIPDKAGRRIKHVSGTFSFAVAAETQTVEITDLHGTMKSPTFANLSNGLRLAVGSERAGSGWLGIGLLRGNASAEQWEDNQRLLKNAKIEIMSREGENKPGYTNSASWGPSEHWIFITSDRNDIAKLIVLFPVAVAKVDMPFAFDDLPMP